MQPKGVRSLLAANRVFLYPYALILASCVAWMAFMSKADIHLAINSLNAPYADTFFRYITEVGTYVVIAPVLLVVLCFRSVREGLTILLSQVFTSIGIQLGKRVIWPDSPRPKLLFADTPDFHWVEGVHVHSHHSFPSGHSGGAFALCCCLAIIAKKPAWKVFWLMLALLAGYSRMYLSQHFLIDVSVGSLFGVIGAVLAAWWISAWPPRPWIDKALLAKRS